MCMYCRLVRMTLSVRSSGLPMVRGYEFIEVTGDDVKLERAKAFINEGLSAGHFQAQIARTFAFEEVVTAYRDLEANSQFGKIVLTLD